MNLFSCSVFLKKHRGSFRASLFIIILSLNDPLFSQAPVELTVPETENSFPGQWCCINDGYIYGTGVNQRTRVLRKRENVQNYEIRGNVTDVDPSYKIENRIYATTIPGL